MARPRRPLDVKGEGPAVLRLIKREPAGWRRERLTAVKLGLEGELNLDEIASVVGRSRSVIQEWFDRFREGGVEKLLSKSSGKGPAPRVTDEVLAEMSEKLRTGEWRTGEQARRWLSEEHGIELHLNRVYHYLGKLGGRLKVPRPVHNKKDHEAADAFRKGLAEHLEQLNIPREKRVRVWVQDEMRYGLKPVTRRVWSLRGVRVVKEVWPRYEWGYVYGALEVGGGNASEFSLMPKVAKEATRLHLEQISRADPDAVHVVIWDGAGFHQQDGDPDVPNNIRLVRLPPYSPELNPAEKLWDIIKDAICNRVFATLDALDSELCEVLRPWWERPEKVRSLVGNGWLLSEVNAT